MIVAVIAVAIAGMVMITQTNINNNNICDDNIDTSNSKSNPKVLTPSISCAVKVARSVPVGVSSGNVKWA